MTIPLAQSQKGEFRQVEILPVQVLPGDLVQQVGNQILVIRGGNVIATRDLTGPSVSVPMSVTEKQTISKAIFFRSAPVPGTVATLTNVVKNTTSGSIRFIFSNGNDREFSSGAQVMTETDYIDTSSKMAEDVLIRKTLINSPDETNLTTCVGGKCSIDMNATQPFTLTVE